MKATSSVIPFIRSSRNGHVHRDEGKWAVAREEGSGEGLPANGYGISSEGDEHVLELDDGDGGTVLHVYKTH